MTEVQEEQLPPKREISAEEFITLLKGDMHNLGMDVTYSKDKNGYIKSIIIKNLWVRGNIHIKGFFFTQLIVQNCIIENFKLGDTNINIIAIKNSTFDVFSTGKNSITNIHISEKSFVGSIILDSATINRLEITDHATIASIILTNSQLEILSISNCVVESLFVQSNTIIGKINIRFSTIGSIFYSHSMVKESHLYHCRIFIIHLIDLDAKCRVLTILSTLIEELKFKLEHKYIISIEESTIYEFDINNSELISFVHILISRSRLNCIRFQKLVNRANIILNDVEPVEELYCFKKSEGNNNTPDFTKREFLFFETRRDSNFWLIDSDLGNTQFISCKFLDFSMFYFQNTKLLEVFIADTTLPHHKSIITGGYEGDNIYVLEQKKLALSQFKKIFENRGDVVKATEYRAEELEIYRQLLKENKAIKNRHIERIHLWLNKFSNYYGNNWLKAVGWTLLFNTILYTFYCWAQGYWFGNNWSTFWELAAYSFEFLNPLRKADFLEHITGKHPGAGAIAIDYVSRIIIAYFVYQTITAFRKFGKSSV